MADLLPFVGWLKEMRRRHDLTQRELAERLRCSVRLIEKIERAERRPSKQLAELIADYFQVPTPDHADFLRFARSDSLTPPHADDWSTFQAGGSGEVHMVHLAQRGAVQHVRLSAVSISAEAASALSLPAPASFNNLPVGSSSPLGREAETEALLQILARSTTHIVTVTGPPGVGKTCLAIEVARRATRRQHRQSVCYVSLAMLSGPDCVLPAIAHALGLAHGEADTVRSVLVKHLAQMKLLLLLDTFEHLAETGALLASFLEECPGVKALITSREVLRLSSEQEFVLTPLPVPPPPEPQPSAITPQLVPEFSVQPEPSPGAPDPSTSLGATSPDIELLLGYSSVRLFCNCAHKAQPDFELDRSSVLAVAEICRQLEGIPLAIKLAAARTRLISPVSLLSRLDNRHDNRLELLTGGPRDMPQRHQTMRNAVEWSYNLLNEQEALLFRRLSIFEGSCSLAALEDVCNWDRVLGIDPLDLVGSLVEKSLLRQVKGPDKAGTEPHFQMLNTIREYAREKLAALGELTIVSAHHLAYYR